MSDEGDESVGDILHDECCWCGTCNCRVDDDNKHYDRETGELMEYSR